jgi:hypothetical protein
MRKILVGVIALGLAALPVAGSAAPSDKPESCFASNPGTSKCSFTVTEAIETPVSGAAGVGSWVVKVKRGKKIVATLASPTSGEPTADAFTYEIGDKVTAEALAPGSGVSAGGE